MLAIHPVYQITIIIGILMLGFTPSLVSFPAIVPIVAAAGTLAIGLVNVWLVLSNRHLMRLTTHPVFIAGAHIEKHTWGGDGEDRLMLYIQNIGGIAALNVRVKMTLNTRAFAKVGLIVERKTGQIDFVPAGKNKGIRFGMVPAIVYDHAQQERMPPIKIAITYMDSLGGKHTHPPIAATLSETQPSFLEKP